MDLVLSTAVEWQAPGLSVWSAAFSVRHLPALGLEAGVEAD